MTRNLTYQEFPIPRKYLERTAPKTYKSSRCPICSCVIIVRQRNGLKASLLRALALADHVKILHPFDIS